MLLKSLGIGVTVLATLGTGVAVADGAASWSGIYAGVEGGFQSTDVDASWPSGAIAPSDLDGLNGLAGGVVAGVNFETSGGFVLGAETDLLLHDLSGFADSSVTPDDGFAFASDLLWSLSARAGYAVSEDVLLFAKAGYSGMDFETRTTFGTSANSSGWLNGYHVGGGLEFRFSDRLSAKAEYRYVDLQGESVKSPFVPSDARIDPSLHLLLLGLNLQFQ